jgi:ribosome modulation factor
VDREKWLLTDFDRLRTGREASDEHEAKGFHREYQLGIGGIVRDCLRYTKTKARHPLYSDSLRSFYNFL